MRIKPVIYLIGFVLSSGYFLQVRIRVGWQVPFDVLQHLFIVF